MDIDRDSGVGGEDIGTPISEAAACAASGHSVAVS
jgi:hypothetical protein